MQMTSRVGRRYTPRALAFVAAAVVPLFACASDVPATPSTTSKAPSTQVAASPSPTQAPLPTIASGLRVARVTTIRQPTQMAFLGPDEALVTQKHGHVAHVRSGTIVGEALRLKANFADERGVLGLALHPQFEQNRYVYVYWTWSGGGSAPAGLVGEATDDIEKVPDMGNRVDRFTWDGTKLNFDRNIIELPSKITNLTLDRRRGNHNGGVIKFGPDGRLYVVIGDQNARGHLTNVEDGPDLDDTGIVAAVLRLNDDGTAPTDNPWYSSAGDEASKIFVYGVRNSFGFDFDPATGRLWLQTNGQAAYDQVGWYQGGDNVGWIQRMGPAGRQGDYKALEVDTTRLLDNPSFPPSRLAGEAPVAVDRLVDLGQATYRPPAFSWRRAVGLTDVQFVPGRGLGADYEGDMLLGDVNTGTLYRLELTSDRGAFALEGALSDGVNDNETANLQGELTDRQILGRGFGVVTDIHPAPDGSMWIASLSQDALYRVTAGN